MTSPAARLALGIGGAILLCAGLLLWALHVPAELPLAARLYVTGEARHLAAIIAVTDLGGAAVMIPVALAATALLWAVRRLPVALWLFGTIASGRIVIEGLKHIVGRARPDEAGHLVEVSSASFPSSHSAGTMLTAIAMLVALKAPRPIVALGLAWPIVVGLTRIMLGVHWPSDVLAGWGFGLIWVAFLARWLPVEGRAAPVA